MPNVLRGYSIRIILSLFALSVSLNLAYSQGCNGADGTGIFNGGIINADNGTRCANQLGQPGFTPGVMEIDIRNIPEDGTVQFQIDWNDGSPFEPVNATRIGPNRFFSSVTHAFPPAGGQVRCEYRPVVRLIFNGTVCNANLGTPPRFVRWNTDDQNTGQLSLLETITNVNEYLVCAGVETNVTFTDRSTLNCVPPALTQGPNTQTRWRQFIYGTQNTITGAVRIGGLPRTFPFNGPVDQSGEPVENSGFPTASTQIITVPATAQPGEFFQIRMNYWNTCNSYAAGRAPVNEFAYIRVVAQPPPPTPDPAEHTVCAGETPIVPRIIQPPGNNIISWWRNNAGDTPGTLITSGTSRQLPLNSIPGYNGTPGVYKVWVSYRPNVANALNCESEKILITRTIRNELTVPDPIIAPVSPVCQGTNISITMPAPASESVGGATNYVFSGTGGMTVSSSNATSATYNTSGVNFSGTNLTATVNVRVARRYTPSNQCQVQRNFPVIVHRTPIGGTPSDFPDVCEGTVVGPITLSGHVGVIQRWQMRTDAGTWNDIAGSAGQVSITPGVLAAGAAGHLYSFRAVVGNGPCADVLSAVETVFVSPNPGITVDAGPDQVLCDVLSTALSGSDPFPGTGVWSYLSSFPEGKPAPALSDPTDRFATITASEPGLYRMRWAVTSGSCTFVSEVSIDFGQTPVLPALPAIDVCDVTTSLNAPVLIAGVGTWSVISGDPTAVTIDNLNQHNSTVSLNGPAFAYGTYVFRWNAVSGNCASDNTEVSVTFNQQPTVSASNVNGICLDPAGNVVGLSASLGGGAPLVPVGSWQVISGDGVIDNVNSVPGTVTGNYNSSNQDYINGSNITIRVLSSIGSVCPAAQQDFIIEVDKTPNPIAGVSPTPACETFIQLDATTPVDAVGMWTGAGVTFDDPADPKTIVRNLPAAPASVDLRWTLTSTGGNNCVAFDEVTVQSVGKPNATNFSPIVCEVLPAGPGGEVRTSVTLIDFEDDVTTETPGNRTIQWFENGPEGLGIPVANPSVTLLNVPENKIYVAKITETVSGSSCFSNAFVTINIRPAPTFTNATLPLCEDSPASNTHANVDLTSDFTYRDVVTTPSNLVTWFDSFGDAASNNPPGGMSPTTFDVVGSRNVFARIEYPSGEACPVVASLNLVVNQIPVAMISGDPTVCMGAPTTPNGNLPVEIYQTASYPGAKYFWTIPTGPGEFLIHEGGDEDDFFVLLKFPFTPSPNPENISVRIELEGCSFTPLSYQIIRSAIPQSPVIIGDDFICAESRDVQFSIDNPSVNDYTWRFYLASNPQQEGGALVATGQNTSLIRANFQNTNVILSVVESNSGNNECVSEPAVLPLTVNPLPNMLSSTPVVCSDIQSGVTFVPDTDAQYSSVDFFNLLSIVPASGLTADPALPVTPLSGAGGMVSNIIYKNTSEIPKMVLYEVAPVNRTMINGVPRDCQGKTTQIILTVNPEPTLESGLGRNVCSEERNEITLRTSINSYPADRFVITSIEQTTDPGNPLVRTGPEAPLNTDLNADAIFNDVWVNPGSPDQNSSAPYIVTYRISAKNSITGCQGSPSVPVAVAVFPKPEISFTANPVCSESNVDIQLDAPNVSGTNTGWTWTVQNITTNLRGAAPGNSPSGNTAQINDVVINESFIPGTVVYRVTATTSLGGKVCSNFLPVSVDINPNPQVTTIPNTPICSDAPNNGLTSVIDLTALEPTIADPAITDIVWFNADPIVNPTAQIGSPTNYSMQHNIPVYAEVTGNAFGCKVIVPVAYTINNALAMQIAETNANCHNANNGSIFAEVTTGGTAPFFFRKNNEPFASAVGSNYTFLALLPNQTYDITVEDSRGCTATTTSQIILEPTPLTLQTFTTTPVDCFFDTNLVKDRNGEIIVVATGSSGNYNYTLFPGGASNSTGTFSNLRPGSYSVVVSDVGNSACKLEVSPAIVDVPDPIEILPIHIPQDSYGNEISCAGAQNGEIHVTARGGTGNYDFSLDPVNPQNPIQQLANQAAVFDMLAPGTYKIFVVDGNGCRGPTSSATIRDVIDLFPGKIGIDQNVCFQQANLAGDATPFDEVIDPFGGPAPFYEYQWEESSDNSTWFTIAGANSRTYDPDGVNPFTSTGTYYYRRLIRTALPVIDLNNRPAFCNDYKGQLDVVRIIVEPKPEVTMIGNAITCQGNDEFYSLRLDVGTAPMRFSWFDGAFTYNNQTANQLSAPYKVGNIQAPVTVQFFNITDAYGCQANPAPIDIDIYAVDASFTVDAPAKCAGEPFEFTFNNQPGIQYVWEFGDGSQLGYPADDPALDGTEGHTYPPAASSQGDANFIVKLTAALDGGNCPNFTFQQVTVRRSIILNVIGAPNEICSGETVTMKDNSTGVTSGVWYYTDELGNRGPDIAGPLSEVPFTLTNTTTNNPLHYFIHYDAQNAFGCSNELDPFPVKVFRAVDASFTVNPNPVKLVGGLATVTITNTSDPVDWSVPMNWDFGEDVLSEVQNGNDFEITYSTDRDRTIRFTLRNPDRLQCFDTHTEILTFDFDQPVVDFTATRAGCYPLTVDVNNLSEVYDRFTWQLTSTNGTNEISNLREPQFSIYDPGTYQLTLTASKVGNSLPVITVGPKTIEVFSKPVAEFFLRQNQAYTNAQIKPVNQSLFACGDCYTWDFGDGFVFDKIFEPNHFYPLEGKYTITLVASVNYGEFDIDDDGIIDGPVICTDETSKDIRIIQGGALKIPNAFTPNVNGPTGGIPDNNFTNDVFMPVMDGVEEFTMQIFDRWGNLIFESRDKNIGWDGYDRNGRLMPAGVYVYKMVLRLGDGQRTTKVGDVTLIR